MSIDRIMDQIGMPNLKYRLVYSLTNNAVGYHLFNLMMNLTCAFSSNGVWYYKHGRENLTDEGLVLAIPHECSLDWSIFNIGSIDHDLVGAAARIDKTIHNFTMDHFFDGKSAVAAYCDKTGQIPFYVSHSEAGHITDDGMRMNIEAIRLAGRYLKMGDYVGVFEGLATDTPETEPSDLVVRVARKYKAKIIPVRVFTWPELPPDQYMPQKSRINAADERILEIHVIFGEPIDSSCERSEIPIVNKKVWTTAKGLRPPGEEYQKAA